MASGINIMEQVVVLLKKDNPKRPGSKARGRFDKYEMGMTRQQALKAGVTGGDLRWDVKHRFIKLVSPQQWEAIEPWAPHFLKSAPVSPQQWEKQWEAIVETLEAL